MRNRENPQIGHNEFLLELQSLFEQCGKSMESQGLPVPISSANELDRHRLQYDANRNQQLYSERYDQLNAEQKAFFDAIKRKIDNRDGGLFFLDGSAGKST